VVLTGGNEVKRRRRMPMQSTRRLEQRQDPMATTVQSQGTAFAGTRTPGKRRSPFAVIGLSIITLGIYGLVWMYQTYQEMKDWSGEGVGGLVGLLIGIIPLVSIVTLFLMPSEVKNLYARDGADAPVSPMTGLWVLLPFLGGLVWLFKVQGALNTYWARER
jgi:hypothetical protein